MPEQTGHCECGKSRFTIHGKPLIRGYCHCTICQQFNQAPFSDISVYRQSDVDMPEDDLVEYKVYQKPAFVQRGKCKTCGKPAIEKLRLPGLPKMVIVPNQNVQDASLLPEPQLHAFYDSRVADVEDGLPKYSGYLASQTVFTFKMIAGLFRGR
ncbi:MAG: GFA family protein [Salinisphaeraceae bacterium]|nr:GFA family protein [Salinisphaeraceae bacterium]